MSSFIVSDYTIHRMVSEIVRDSIQPYTMFKDMTPDQVGEALRKMNAKAFNQRYKNTVKQTPYNYIETDGSKFQTFKAFDCFLYQCSEGNVPNSKLFKAVREIQNTLACEIVCESREYSKAAWG